MAAYLAVQRAVLVAWTYFVRPLVGAVLGICAALVVLIFFVALLAGLFAAVAKVWP